MTRHPVMTVIMVIFGVILLLPGLCAVFFIAAGMDVDVTLALLWLICFLIAAAGVWVLIAAFR